MERLSTLLKAVQEICGRGSYGTNSVSIVVLFHSHKIIFCLWLHFCLIHSRLLFLSHSNYERNGYGHVLYIQSILKLIMHLVIVMGKKE